MDGEIDVDRADYLLRDARALGLEFAAYDLNRLIHNLVLVKHSTLGFITAVDERGLTAVESFYISRARSHQVLVRHHKCAQLCASLRFASVSALESDPGRLFLNELLALENADDSKRATELLKQFAEHDDPWWLQALRSVEAQNHAGSELLKATLQLILRRQPTLKSLWKRKGDLSNLQIVKLNALLDSPERGSSFQDARRRLASEDVLLVLHRFRPYGVTLDGRVERDSIVMIKTGDRLIPVVQLSPLIRSLQAAWEEDLHLHAFALKTSTVTKDKVIRTLLRSGAAKKEKAGSKTPPTKAQRRRR